MGLQQSLGGGKEGSGGSQGQLSWFCVLGACYALGILNGANADPDPSHYLRIDFSGVLEVQYRFQIQARVY